MQVQSQAAAEQASIQAQMQRTLQAKDSEIQGLLADRSRLEAALSSIKGQITAAASPARSVPPQNKALVRASVDSSTLRSVWTAMPISSSYQTGMIILMTPLPESKRLQCGCRIVTANLHAVPDAGAGKLQH